MTHPDERLFALCRDYHAAVVAYQKAFREDDTSPEYDEAWKKRCGIGKAIASTRAATLEGVLMKWEMATIDHEDDEIGDPDLLTSIRDDLYALAAGGPMPTSAAA